MTIVRCPRCKDEVTIPAKATGRALVRCPLCLEEYMLAEALASAPPPLVIIGGEVPEEIVTKPAASENEYRLASDLAAQAGDVAAQAVVNPAQPAAMVMPARPVLRTRTRPRASSQSGLILAVNYVGGGILGLALGLLVLWWAFRRDPLELGPKFAPYVPWVVPQEFRGHTRLAESGDEPSQARGARKTAAPGAAASRATSGAGQTPQAAFAEDRTTELQTLPALDAPASTHSGLVPSIDAPTLDPGGVRPPEGARAVPPAPPDDDSASASSAADSAAAAERVSRRPSMPDLANLFGGWPQAAPPPERHQNSPLTAGQFVQAVDDALTALRSYEQRPKADSDGRQQAFTELWRASSAAGRALANLDPAAADLTESIESLETILLSLRGARRSAVRFLTLQHWPELRHDEGVLVTGKIQELAPAGDAYLLVLDAAARDIPLNIALVSPRNPQDRFAVGDEIIVVGQVVDEPQKHVPGFAGDQPRVVVMSFAVKAPQ